LSQLRPCRSEKRAAEAFERTEPAPIIRPPLWLSKGAKKIWKKKIAEIAGLKGGADLLDALDGEMLAVYCDAVWKYMQLSNLDEPSLDDHKMLASYMSKMLQYADRLGFTPGSRARLIKKRAEANDDPFGMKYD
jgi:phage terminase small subunit